MIESIHALNAVPTAAEKATEVRDAFTNFVGQTFFAQMMKAMRSAQGKPAYFHGGRAEEVFQSQFDQTLVETMSRASADRFSGPIFEHQFPQHAAVLRAAAAQADSQP